MKIFILATATALGFTAAASADEFRLDAASMDSVTAGGTVAFETNVVKNVDINKNVELNVNKNVNSAVAITGNLATAEGSAELGRVLQQPRGDRHLRAGSARRGLLLFGVARRRKRLT